MSFMPPSRQRLATVANHLPGVQRLAQSALLASVSCLCITTSSLAAEQVILRFETTEVTIPTAGIANFIRKGEVDSADLQSFFQKYPKAQQILRDILGKEITVSRNFGERFFRTSTGEFVLTQLDKLINSPAPNAGLESLRTALLSSYQDDNRFSLLELLDKYPGRDLRLDVSLLERVYGDVSAFVERIQPALEVVKGVLQDFVCECPQNTALDAPSGQTQTKSALSDPNSTGAPSKQAGCVKPQTTSDIPPTSVTPTAIGSQ